MDQLQDHQDKTFSACIVMDLKEVAVGTGLVSMVDKRVVRKPLFHWLLRIQQSEVPKNDKFEKLPEGQWLPIIEGPVHWNYLDEQGELAPTTLVDSEVGKHDVLFGVKALRPFIVKAKEVDNVMQKLLLAKHFERTEHTEEQMSVYTKDLEPYFVNEEKGFAYYQIPIDEDLQRQIQATEKFSAMGDLYRAEWLWKNHPAYSKHKGQPLLTGAFIGAHNPETDKGEIYFAIYRGQVSLSDGGRLRFWDKEMEIIDTGLLVRQGKNLLFVRVPNGAVQPLDMETARPVYQFANKKDMMKFLGSADDLDLGSWHVSLQYVGGKWFSGGRSMSKRMEDKLLANITSIVDLSRHELAQAAEAEDAGSE